MNNWVDMQIRLLEMLVESIKGNCLACKEPCQDARNGGGHSKKCWCH